MVEQNNDSQKWQTLLEQVEKDLQESQMKITALQSTRNYLRSLLGLSIDNNTPVITNFQPAQNNTDLGKQFSAGDFYGLSQADAGYQVLLRAGKQLHIDDIYEILTNTGYTIGGREPKHTLYVSMSRSVRFVIVAPNIFDLAERRPKARKSRKESQESSLGQTDDKEKKNKPQKKEVEKEDSKKQE